MPKILKHYPLRVNKQTNRSLVVLPFTRTEPLRYSMFNLPKNIITAIFLVFSLSTIVSAARFPDAVEKNVTLEGEGAPALAKLLGLTSGNKATAQLPLGQSDAWAVYLLKLDTPRKLLNSGEGMPERHNSIHYSSAPHPSISIGPFWLDRGTALPTRQPGVYSFSSPWISGVSKESGSWQPLIEAMRGETRSKGRDSPAERRFHFMGGATLTVRLWTNDANEFTAAFYLELASQKN